MVWKPMVWKLAAIAIICAGASFSIPPALSQDSDVISAKQLDPGTKKAFFKKMKSREAELARGVVESTLIPVYPTTVRHRCPLPVGQVTSFGYLGGGRTI